MDAEPSREELIEGLESFAEEVDGVPTVRKMRSDGPHSPYYYKEEFGSWHDGLRAAGIQPTHGVSPDVDREELVEELKRVNDVIERPPRRTDVEEHGEYSYALYDEAFDSFVHALLAADIEPDEKQYRFSSVETPEGKRGSANIEKLRNHGPVPSSELPQGRSTIDRQRGVWKFTVNSGSTQPSDAIYYLHGEHAPELVIRRFFQQNPHVLEYREPHGIKIDIKNHQPSWKEIGREIVDELIEVGLEQTAACENLVVLRVHQSQEFRYCFDSSVAEPADVAELPVAEDVPDGSRPVWGFPRDHEEIWSRLSERDGLLFSTREGLLTHYVPVADTLENTDVMTELWVEYEDGVRHAGIERPWPFVLFGEEVQEISIPTGEFLDEMGLEPNEEPLQCFDADALTPFLTRYGGFETYLRELERSPDSESQDTDLDDGMSEAELVEFLRSTSRADVVELEESDAFDDIERTKREAAFQTVIEESYERCAICGNQFESPDGAVDLEAAYVLPRSAGGLEIPQNGIALCSRHHWAFRNGWFEVDEDYGVHVRNYPDLEGYSQIKRYEGASIHVPDEADLRPLPEYLRGRNRLRSQ